ncbi:hypothetical protein N665_0116s0015 [Sinapis alba]|nr:hypothetical protein N665_0116s0015 [Sinapis alba]
MNKNVSVGYYDKTESIQISKKKGDEDEKQNSIETRPGKRDISENLRLDAQENVHEQIERQRREGQDNLKQQSNQQRGVETKGSDVRFRLEQFYNLQRTKQQQFQAQQQEQEPTQQQQQPLASHFTLYPLVEKLANAVENGTPDQNSNALVNELSSYFNKSQQLLNSLSGSKPMYVDGEKRKLEDSEKLLQQRRELIVEYRKSVEDILKIEP